MKLRKTFLLPLLLASLSCSQAFGLTPGAVVEIDNDNKLTSANIGWTNQCPANWTYINQGNHGDARISPSTSRDPYVWLNTNYTNGFMGQNTYGIDLYLSDARFNDPAAEYGYIQVNGGYQVIKTIDQNSAPAGWFYLSMYTGNPSYSKTILTPSGRAGYNTGADSIHFCFQYH